MSHRLQGLLRVLGSLVIVGCSGQEVAPAPERPDPECVSVHGGNPFLKKAVSPGPPSAKTFHDFFIGLRKGFRNFSPEKCLPRERLPECTIDCGEIDFESREPDHPPPLDDPQAVPLAEAVDLFPDDVVLGVAVGAEERAYPFRVLARHEVINDTLGGRRIAVVMAPLAGAATVLDLGSMGLHDGMGNTGGLYRSDLVLYDRGTRSWWSHLRREAVRGPRRGTAIATVPSLRTTLEAWSRLHPASSVVTTDTGHPETSYDGDPYAWYEADADRLLSPVRFLDLRLPRKEPVLCVTSLDGAGRAYPLARLSERGVLTDRIDGRPVLVVTDRTARIALAFDPTIDGRELDFTLLPPDAAAGEWAFMRDTDTGSGWTVEGLARSGPLAGRRLVRLDAPRAYWFAWAAFHPGTEIWGHEERRGPS
jgi:hypothetical protein